jgi:hypothetical protein
LVDPLPLQEAVIHHAQSEKQNKKEEDNHEEDRDDSRQWSLFLRARSRVRILIHQSRLNSDPGPTCDPPAIHSRSARGVRNLNSR